MFRYYYTFATICATTATDRLAGSRKRSGWARGICISPPPSFAFVTPEVLPVLFVLVLFAFALAATGEAGRPVLDLIDAASKVFFRMVGLIMWAAPAGAFGAIAFTVGKFGWSSLIQLGSLIAEFYVVCAVFTALVFGLIARAVRGGEPVAALGPHPRGAPCHRRHHLVGDGPARLDGQDARCGLR